jgi:hypothetical protein
MSEDNKSRSIYLGLDRFQRMKLKRMSFLLGELEARGEMNVNEFLGSIAVNYGIRETTGKEYLEDFVKGGYITIQENTIKLVKKP